MELVGGLAASGDAGGDIGGGLAVELGVEGVGETEFEAAEQLVLERGAHLHVPGGRQDDVDTEAEAARGDVGDDRFEHLVLVLEGAPAVDEEEDIAPGLLREAAFGPPAAVGGDGVDGVGPEELLPLRQDARDLRDGPADAFGVEAEATEPTCGRSTVELRAPPPKSSP